MVALVLVVLALCSGGTLDNSAWGTVAAVILLLVVIAVTPRCSCCHLRELVVIVALGIMTVKYLFEA